MRSASRCRACTFGMSCHTVLCKTLIYETLHRNDATSCKVYNSLFVQSLHCRDVLSQYDRCTFTSVMASASIQSQFLPVAYRILGELNWFQVGTSKTSLAEPPEHLSTWHGPGSQSIPNISRCIAISKATSPSALRGIVATTHTICISDASFICGCRENIHVSAEHTVNFLAR